MAQKPTAIHNFHSIADEQNLKKFVQLAWGVKIPDVQVCENHTTPWRAFADAYFARDSVAVWKASRGFGGKSYLLALLGLTEAVTLKANVNILGGSGEQSENVHKYTQDFWNYEQAPKSLLVSDPSKRETKLVWGNYIKALQASQRSVRGPHPQRLRLDEIDEMALDIFDAAMGQTMATDDIAAQTVASSTHQNANGTMTEVLQRATEKGWPIMEWCHRETVQGWLMHSEVERKRSEVTATMWNTEYDLQEPSPGARAILPSAVATMFKQELGTFEGYNREYIEIEPPQEGATYSHGADWARKVDWTVIITIRRDTNPMRIVAFERTGRMPWPLMISRLDERVRRYGGYGNHDGTGVGDVVDAYSFAGLDPFIMVGRARSDLLTEYIAAIERQEIESPFIKFMHGEHKYASNEDVYGSRQGSHLPDTIAAGALAYRETGLHFG